MKLTVEQGHLAAAVGYAGRRRGYSRGQTFSEGAGDADGAVALDHGGRAGGRRARLGVTHAL